MRETVILRINGKEYRYEVAPQETLLEVLRKRLGFTGTKEACGIGDCGACTVLVDGNAVLACLTLAIRVQGKDILTIEGLAKSGDLHPLQKAFINHGAIQCGFCTPGMIMSAKALLDKTPKPSDAEARSAIEGNLCRCTGYKKIVEAILSSEEG